MRINGLRKVPVAILAFLTVVSTHSIAEEAEEPSRYAPGSKGVVEGLDIGGIIDAARRNGAAMQSDLPQETPDLQWDPQAAAAGNSATSDQMRKIEQMLGLKEGSAALPASSRKSGARVLIFATFGMPDASLKALVHDAMKAEATVVFQGFVENSIPKTGEAVRRIFGDEPEFGMAIDPTAFSRFNVIAAPVIVALAEPLISCKTRHCAEDIVPAHDRISGNATLEFALNAIVERGEAGVFSAGVALDRLKEAQK